MDARQTTLDTANPTNTGTVWLSETDAVAHANWYCFDSRRPDYPDQVGRRAFAEQCCIWHAAHLVTLDLYNTGEIPTVACPYCGGRADIQVGYHHLCAARTARGLPTPHLDVVDSVRCGCAGCRTESQPSR